jgi:PPP family 3-phenylpropionic acid transporter
VTQAIPFRRLAAYFFSYFAFMGIYMPFFGLYLQHKGYGSEQIGMLMAILQVVRLLAPAPWGMLADHLGKRTPIVRLAAVLSASAFATLIWDGGVWPLIAALACMGFFWAAQGPLTEALLLAHLGKESGRYGQVRLWGSVGFVVAVLLMGWWLERASIQWVYWGGLAMLMATAGCAFCMPDAAMAPRSHGSSVMEILRRREVLAVLIGVMLMTAAHGTLYVFYTIHLVGAGYSKTVAGMMWTLGVLAEIVLMARGHRVMKRFSLQHLFMFAFGCGVLRFAVIGWCVDYPVVMVLAQCLHGATFGLCHLAAVSAIHRWFGDAHQAQGQAWFSSISYGAGGIIGSFSSGWLWVSLGAGWAFTCSSALALAGGLVLWRGLKNAD